MSRVEAENLVMRYAKERDLPAVAPCVSNTYGPRSSFGRTDADSDAGGENR